MSSEDISRYLFQPGKHYVDGRMQTGRVITDDDLNAPRRLHSEDARRTLAEIICSKGTPNNGFRISFESEDETAAVQWRDFRISAGSFYLGGLRFEIGEGESIGDQKDWLQADAARPGGEAPNLPEISSEAAPHLCFLRGYEQCVSAVEDNEIIEHALGGPDTSVFVRRMRRVEVLELPEGFEGGCAEAFEVLETSLTSVDGETVATLDPESCELRSEIRLTVGFSEEPTEDPCQPQVTAGFIGAENQAIRVQLTAPDRFVWGYDNAALLYRVQVIDVEGEDGERRGIRFLTLPRDRLSQPTSEHVVEILRWGAELPNGEKVAERTGHVTRVAASFNPDPNAGEPHLVIEDPVDQAWLDWFGDHGVESGDQYFFLRVWTGGPPADDAARPDHGFDPGGDPVRLTGTGLTLDFTQRGRRGDYWIIAARPNTPASLVPWKLLEQAPPAGPREYFAPLALIEWTRAPDQRLVPSIHDCREKFRPLCASTGCCTYTVGDGATTHGIFNSIQQAVDHLPEEGGEICLLPGLHRANVRIEGKRDICIKGCGKQSRVVPGPDQSGTPVFTVVDSNGIVIEHADVVNFGGTALSLEQVQAGELADILIAENRIVGGVHAIRVRGGSRIHVYWNRIRVLDKQGALEAILMLAEDSLVERNDIGVQPAPPEPPDETPPEDRDPSDPCAKPEVFYGNRLLLERLLDAIFRSLPALDVLIPDLVRPYRALGGMRVAAGSERIRVLENRIVGGAGHGVSLGGPLPRIIEGEAPEDSRSGQTLRHEQEKIWARFTEAGSPLTGIAVRFVRVDASGPLHDGVTDSAGYVLVAADPGEYRVRTLSPGHEVAAVDTTDLDEFGTLHEIVARPVQAPPDEALGFVYESAIERNAIEAMGLSGIGNPLDAGGRISLAGATFTAVAVLPAQSLPAGNPLIGGQIVDNQISGCFRRPVDEALGSLVGNRGLGGVSLDLASAVRIAGNDIRGNGSAHSGPACGVFIGVGDQLEIHGNEIVDNGNDPDASAAPSGVMRGGIVAGVAFRLFPSAGRFGWFRDYAARIHDNLVHQPVGHALLLGGAGPMSVDANRLHTLRSAPEALGRSSATVLVFNLGEGATISGSTSFNSNQVLGGKQAGSITNATVATRDDLGFDANQIEARNGGILIPASDGVTHRLWLRFLINALLIGGTVRASDSRLQEPENGMTDPEQPVQDALFSLVSLAVTMNNTVSNQGDHCIFADSAEGSTRVRDSLNQVFDDRLCSRNNDAIAAPAYGLLLDRIGALVFRGVDNFTSAPQSELSEPAGQVLQGAASAGLVELQQMENRAAVALVDIDAEARALVQREVARLAARHGEEHGRVEVFRSHLGERLATSRDLAVNADIAGTRISPVQPGGMRIHGAVADRDGRGVPGLFICLVDPQGETVKGFEPVTTKRSGYFAFTFDADQVKALSERYPEGLHLSLFTSRGTFIHTTPEPVPITPDGREIVNIRLDRRNGFEVVEPGKPGAGPEPGRVTVEVPDLTGLSEDEARQKLKSAGLAAGEVTSRTDAEKAGTVVDQNPAAGKQLELGSAVSFVIAVKPDEEESVAARIIDRMAEDAEFQEIRASREKLLRLAKENDITSLGAFRSLLDRENKQIRDLFKLPNLENARSFKRLLKRVLEDEG